MAQEQIDIKQSNKILIWTCIIATILIIGLLTNGFGLLTSQVISNQQFVPLEIGNSPVKGDPNAPVTIFIFSDFSCPYCQAAEGENAEIMNQLKSQTPGWEAPVPKITEEYVNTGKAKLVFKYFPGHGAAKSAHQVAFALNEQNLFWEYHDAAFKNPPSSMSKAKDLAESIGADMEKLEVDFEANNYAAQLQADTAMGQSNKVQGTPSFFINNKPISGAQSFSTFKNIIDKEL